MKLRNYKQTLFAINKHQEVILTISLWTHNSSRMTFKVPFSNMMGYFDSDMTIVGINDKLSFTTINGKKHRFLMNKLRIAKLDYAEIQEQGEKCNEKHEI